MKRWLRYPAASGGTTPGCQFSCLGTPPEQFTHSICLQNWPCVSVRLQGYTHRSRCVHQPLTVCTGAQFLHEASLQLVRKTWAASENWGHPHHLNRLSLLHLGTGMLGSYHPSVLCPVNPSLPDPQSLRTTRTVRLHVQTALGICNLGFPSANTSKHSIKYQTQLPMRSADPGHPVVGGCWVYGLYSYPAHVPHCQTQYQCWGRSSTIAQELNVWDNLEFNPQHCPPKKPHIVKLKLISQAHL